MTARKFKRIYGEMVIVPVGGEVRPGDKASSSWWRLVGGRLGDDDVEGVFN
jgi:hypothetical protein